MKVWLWCFSLHHFSLKRKNNCLWNRIYFNDTILCNTVTNLTFILVLLWELSLILQQEVSKEKLFSWILDILNLWIQFSTELILLKNCVMYSVYWFCIFFWIPCMITWKVTATGWLTILSLSSLLTSAARLPLVGLPFPSTTSNRLQDIPHFITVDRKTVNWNTKWTHNSSMLIFSMLCFIWSNVKHSVHNFNGFSEIAVSCNAQCSVCI